MRLHVDCYRMFAQISLIIALPTGVHIGLNKVCSCTPRQPPRSYHPLQAACMWALPLNDPANGVAVCEVTFDALFSVLLSMHFSAVVIECLHFPKNSEVLLSAEGRMNGVCALRRTS